MRSLHALLVYLFFSELLHLYAHNSNPCPCFCYHKRQLYILHESKCTALCYTAILTLDWDDLTSPLINILPQRRTLEGHTVDCLEDRMEAP